MTDVYMYGYFNEMFYSLMLIVGSFRLAILILLFAL